MVITVSNFERSCASQIDRPWSSRPNERKQTLSRANHSALRKMCSLAKRRHASRAAALLAGPNTFRHDCGNRSEAATNVVLRREALMRRVFSGVLASVLALSATAALAQTKPPLKLGGIL